MSKILTAPFRMAIGWGISPRVLGLIGVTMLFILRITIGWHFHSEGIEKYRKGNWDAAPFFANAKGPFADQFRAVVWDYKGEYRRNTEFTQTWFAQFVDDAAYYYSMTDELRKEADDALASTMDSHAVILEQYTSELSEYDLGLERLVSMQADASRMGVSSLSGQIDTVRRENDDLVKPVLSEFDQLWEGFEARITAIGMKNFLRSDPPTPLPLQKPRTARVDTSVLNKIVPYFDLAIGWCLLIGLFTPLAALAAAGFLGSVFLSQYPPTTGPSSSMYQLVECMACLVLAGTGAGRFAGLDYFLHLFVRKNESNDATKA